MRQFYSDRTRVVNCQYDRMSNHTKIHQEDVWLLMNGWNSRLTMSSSGSEVSLTLHKSNLLKEVGLPDLA